MELGIITFGDWVPDPQTGQLLPGATRMVNLLEEARLADEVGLDVFGLGEHHRGDYIVSAPPVVLAAIAAQTKRIRLSSAVTVLSSEDPVRVYQQFAELDLISNGRAEIMAGRGSFIESFPLFGYDLQDYDELYTEKIELLLAVRDNERITWSGKHRPPLDNALVMPRAVQDPLPIWIAVGGTPESVFRAGALGLPLTLAIIGGEPARFAPLVRLYHHAADVSNADKSKLRVGINVHAHIGDTTQQALNEMYPYYRIIMDRIGKERGWPPFSRASFDASAAPGQNLLVGSPQQVAEGILQQHELFAQDRYMVQLGVGNMDHKLLLKAIERFGNEVAPMVRKALATPVS